METTNKSPKSPWLFVALFSLVAFALGFTLSSQDEKTRFSEIGSVAQAHLVYALQLKDDMAVIDWSKSLEKLPSVVVFQAKDQIRILAKGGNENLYPSNAPQGLSYRFPDQWLFHSSGSSNGNTFEYGIVFQDQRGPLFWGLCFFLCVGAATWAMFAMTRRPQPQSSPVITKPVPKTPLPPAPVLSQLDPHSLAMTLDKDYLICQITPSAAQQLGQEVSSLLDHHFLDLLPDPLVMKAIADSQETRLLKPFPSHPDLSATLKPVPHGTLLILETSKVVERA